MKHQFRKFAMLAALVAGTALAPALAHAELSVGNVLGTTISQVSAALEQQGYSVSEIEMEDGKIEAEVTVDNQALEIEVDAATGKILELENETE